MAGTRKPAAAGWNGKRPSCRRRVSHCETCGANCHAGGANCRAGGANCHAVHTVGANCHAGGANCYAFDLPLWRSMLVTVDERW